MSESTVKDLADSFVRYEISLKDVSAGLVQEVADELERTQDVRRQFWNKCLYGDGNADKIRDEGA